MKYFITNIFKILFYDIFFYIILWPVWDVYHITFKVSASVSLLLATFLAILNAISGQLTLLIKILMMRFKYTMKDLDTDKTK